MADTEAIKLLRSIDGTLRKILQAIGQAMPVNGGGAAVADDRDLDGEYGDPQVKFEPRDWHGENCKGLRMSECPAAFLEMIAETFDYFARKADDSGELANNGKPVAPYKRRDAARARGWALRKRNGWKPATVDRRTGEILDEQPGPQPGGFEQSEWPTDADIPF